MVDRFKSSHPRFLDRLSLDAEMRLIFTNTHDDPLYDLRKDDYVGITLEYHLWLDCNQNGVT